MPGRDKTGPSGIGPMTGRRMGLCSDSDISNHRLGYRRGNRGGMVYGRGYGLGFGYGYRNRFVEDNSAVSEKTIIENEIRLLKDKLSSLEEQLKKSNGGKDE